MNFDFADVKPDLKNLLTVTVMAIIGIVVLKYVFNRYPVTGLTELLNAV
jgi:ABC-type glycerol-3-phosphate transport system permease component